MTEPLPAWEMKRYSILWRTFGKNEFSNEEAVKALKLRNAHQVSILFYDLRRKGWIRSRRDHQDRRRKIYCIKEPNEAIRSMRT